MKIKKVIYFRYIPLTQKVYEDFYMQTVLDAGLEVEYWDISQLFFEHTHGQEDSSHLLGDRVVRFDNYDQVADRIQQEDRLTALFISIVTYEPSVARLFKLLTQYGCQLGVFGRNMFPTGHLNQTRHSLFQKLLRATPAKVYRLLKAKRTQRFKKSGQIKSYDVIFQGGTQGWRGVGMIDFSEVAQAQIVEVNSDDYDRYLELRDAPRQIEGAYILFLDEYLPLHPDVALFFRGKNVSPEEYYPVLNAYFDRIEEQFGMKVVVAAHPKALKYKEESYFNGREVLFGQTERLVRDAHFVLAHDTTSIAYAIAFGVRLHLLTSRAIQAKINEVHCNVLNFSAYIGCGWQYMDNLDSVQIADVDTQGYSRYKYDFLCSKQTENQHTKDVFINFLRA